MENNIYEILDKLTDEIKGSKKSMFSAGKIIDEDRCVELINAIFNSLPQEVKEAQYLIKNKETLMSEAQQRADSMVAEAERRSRDMVAESSVLKEARRQAEAIVEDARDYSDYLETETKKRIDEMFVDTERVLNEMLGVIRSCREDLMGTMIRKGEL